ncbi:MAG: SDR family oxidoreductase [Patescibacteria group bacterium]
MKVKAKPHALVIGGSSGLGLAIGQALAKKYQVIVTGRTDPKKSRVRFRSLPLTPLSELASRLDAFCGGLPQVDLLVYAAGFYQEGLIDELKDEDVLDMFSVGSVAPALLVQRIVRKQGVLNGFIAVSSTSQWVPRKREPVYTATKAALAQLSHSLAEDERIKKVMVVAPAGMNTPFWKDPKDTATMLDPQWVAKNILVAYCGEYGYRFARILREPPRVEVVVTE